MSINSENKKTITSIFMMPTLGHNFPYLKSQGYIAAYRGDSSQDYQYDDAIYALFKPSNIETFNDFLEKEYRRTNLLIEDYNLDEKHIVLVYKQLSRFKNDYELVKQGKYSKTSKAFQELFPKYVYLYENGGTTEETSIQYKIFNKSPDLVNYWAEKVGQALPPDQELWTMYEPENEILNFKNGK
jgi:hypothetical protein